MLLKTVRQLFRYIHTSESAIIQGVTSHGGERVAHIHVVAYTLPDVPVAASVAVSVKPNVR